MSAPAEQWERGDLNLMIAAVKADDPHSAMYRTTLAQRNQQRRLIWRQRMSVGIAKRKYPVCIVERQIAHVIKPLGQKSLGRLIEEEQIAVLVGEPDWHGQTISQLPHQDQADVALRHARIVTISALQDEPQPHAGDLLLPRWTTMPSIRRLIRASSVRYPSICSTATPSPAHYADGP